MTKSTLPPSIKLMFRTIIINITSYRSFNLTIILTTISSLLGGEESALQDSKVQWGHTIFPLLLASMIRNTEKNIKKGIIER